MGVATCQLLLVSTHSSPGNRFFERPGEESLACVLRETNHAQAFVQYDFNVQTAKTLSFVARLVFREGDLLIILDECTCGEKVASEVVIGMCPATHINMI